MLLLILWGLNACVQRQGVSLVRHTHRPLGAVGLSWRLAGQRGMGPLSVVEVEPATDDPFGLEAIGQLVQVDCLILERAPEAFDEDVVHAPAPAVHGDRDTRVFEDTGEAEAGELAALVG